MTNIFYGDTIAAFGGPTFYIPEQVSEVVDPLGQRPGKVIKANLHNETPPSEDARLQLASGFVIPKEEETWLLQRFMIPSAAEGGPPAIAKEGPEFLQVMQMFAPPFEGVSTFAFKLADLNGNGKNWLEFRRRETYSFDCPWRREVITNHWYEFVAKIKVSQSSGYVEIWLDGEHLTFWKSGETSSPSTPDTTKLEYKTLEAGVNDELNNSWMSTVYRHKSAWEPFSIYFDVNAIATNKEDLEKPEEPAPIPGGGGPLFYTTWIEQLENAPVLDSLQRTENPLLNGSLWVKNKNTEVKNIGKATSTGWVGQESGKEAAALWATVNWNYEPYVIATMAVRPTSSEVFLIMMQSNAVEATIESYLFCELERVSESGFWMEMGYFKEGNRTGVSGKEVTVLAGDRIAMTLDGTDWIAWQKSGVEAWTERLKAEASKAKFASLGAKPGILSAAGNSTMRITNFCAGNRKRRIVPRMMI